MMTQSELKSNLYELQAAYEKTELDFDQEFNKAYDNVQNLDVPQNEIETLLKVFLTATLMRYEKSQPRTNMGRIGRFFSPLVRGFLNIFSFKSLKRKR